MTIAPGYVQTDMNRDIWEPLAPHLDSRGRLHGSPPEGDPGLARIAEVYSRTVSRTPLGRYGRPEEVAALVVLLAGDAAAFATGATFYIDGGYLTRI